MKSIFKLTICLLLALCMPAFCFADNDGKGADDKKKDTIKSNEPWNNPESTVFIVFNWGMGHKNMPRSMGYIDMDLYSSSTIIAECSGLGMTQFLIYTADDNRIVDNCYVDTDSEPTVLIDFPTESGQYVIRAVAEGYFNEWEFTVKPVWSQIRNIAQ